MMNEPTLDFAGHNITLTEFQRIETKMKIIQWEIFAGYCILFVISIALVAYLRQNRYIAYSGSSLAARKLILPAFEPLVCIITVISGFYCGYFIVILWRNTYDSILTHVQAYMFAAGKGFVSVLVIAFMYQSNVSCFALLQTALYSLLFVAYEYPILLLMEKLTSNIAVTISIVYIMRCIRISFFGCILVWPPPRASPNSIRQYCIFSIVNLALQFVYTQLVLQNLIMLATMVTSFSSVWASLYPILMYRLLCADTMHWRNFVEEACNNKLLYRATEVCDESEYSTSDKEGVLKRKNMVIDFAYLNILNQIGSGTKAIVYQATLRSKVQVAVKMYTPNVFSSSCVSHFSNVAAEYGMMMHPNIIAFYGICICPPSLCLVTELCDGSLQDAMQSCLKRERKEWTINIQLSFMIDMARSIDYLHRQSPPFVHTNLKPGAFFVAKNGATKLAKFSTVHDTNTLVERDAITNASTIAILEESNAFAKLKSPQLPLDFSLSPSMSSIRYTSPSRTDSCVRSILHDEPSNIYSLCMSFWNILHPESPILPIGENTIQVQSWLHDVHVPVFDAHVDSRLESVIRSGWHADPTQRPTINKILHQLENIQVHIHLPLIELIQNNVRMAWRGSDVASYFAGTAFVSYLLESGICTKVSECIRLGNAFMSIKRMHHYKHQKCFDNTSEFYYFHVDSIGSDSDSNHKCSVSSIQGNSCFNERFDSNQYVHQAQIVCSCDKWSKGEMAKLDVSSKSQKIIDSATSFGNDLLAFNQLQNDCVMFQV